MADNIETEEGETWVFDSLVNFLHGNIWKIPVLGFVEEKSVVFDPDSYNNSSDEKDEEFRKIHEEYKGLVDFMLSSFMEDLQVTPEQVEAACQIREKDQSNISDSFITKIALEQLQAAEDFAVFRRIMTRKNIDLQLQSLELLVAKYGVLSPSLRSEGSVESTTDNGEEDFLQVVIRYCDGNIVLGEREVENVNHINLSNTLHNAFRTSSIKGEDLVVNIALSHNNSKELQQIHENLEEKLGLYENNAQESQISNPASYNSLQNPYALADKNQSQLMHQEMVGAEDLSKFLEETTLDASFPVEKIKTVPIQPQLKPIKKESRKTVKFDETTVAEIAHVAPEQHRILSSVRKALEVDSENESVATSWNFNAIGSEEEIQKRREYLSAQRDKLVALKKQEREKQLQGESSGSHASRPKSARAAQIALRSPLSSAGGGKSLAARRALAARLKQELLDN